MVKRVSGDVLQIVRTDPKVQAGDQQRIREVIETKLLPHFDFERMTALAMGRNWPKATPEQQKLLVDQFRTLLVRTYSGALSQYRDQTMEYKPLRADPAATDVIVRTEVIRSGQAPVQIDYGMTKTAAGWKAYDVIVGGVSLVTNYRDEFNEQIKSGGVDGLIKTLTDKNNKASRPSHDRAAPATNRAADSSPTDGRWTFAGTLTFADAAAVFEASRKLPLPATGVVDLAGLAHADSSALAVMLALKRRAVGEGSRLAFAAIPHGRPCAGARLRRRGTVGALIASSRGRRLASVALPSLPESPDS